MEFKSKHRRTAPRGDLLRAQQFLLAVLVKTRAVVERAHATLRGITGIEVLEKSCKVRDDRIVEYRVRLRLLFDVAPRLEQHW